MNTNNNLPESIKNIAIIGLGLLGGSLGFILRKRLKNVKITAYARNPQTIAEAIEANAIDSGSTDPQEVLQEADLSIICLPLDITETFAEENIKYFKKNSIVVDVGSVKNRVVKKLTPLFAQQNVEFLGCHPMAGSHHSGFSYATEDLYKGATCFVTPTDINKPSTIKIVSDLWSVCGMETNIISSEEHDELSARTSHSLHLVAAATVNSYLKHEKSTLATGGAFRDFSRIAGSSPEMWTAISEHNKEQIISAMSELENEVAKLRQLLEQEKWKELNNYLTNSRNKYYQWFENWSKKREQK